MNILEIAKYVWNHSHAISFGLVESWDSELFTQAWAKAQTPIVDWKSYGPGWYWFSVSMNYADLHAVLRPATLPQNGCDIGAISHMQVGVFGEDLLCQPDENGSVVVYNGHEKNVSARVRSHFTLQNHRTGALGLKHFPLSHRAWTVRLFSAPCLSDLDDEGKAQMQLLMNSRSGRCAVESAWRSTFGWPVLCKG